MDHRKPSELPISRFKIVQRKSKILHETISPNTYSCKVKVGKKKYRKNESINPTNKIFNYPGWKSNYNLIKELKTIFENKNI